MSDVSRDEASSAEHDAADDAAVRARLSKEVAAWSAERSGRVQSAVTELVPAEARPARPTRPASKRQPRPAKANPASAPNKPFSMSYDGVTSREYMDQVIARGSR